MNISKEEYVLKEDIITIITEDLEQKRHVDVIYQYYYSRIPNLDLILDEMRAKYGEVKVITVLAEEPLYGRIFRYDSAFDKWNKLGEIEGYG